jgi:hypothetical protein
VNAIVLAACPIIGDDNRQTNAVFPSDYLLTMFVTGSSSSVATCFEGESRET